MYPIIPIGPARIESRSLFILIAIWATMEIGARLTRRAGLDGDHVYNGGLYALAVGVIAGRLAHVALFWPVYREEPLQIVSLNPNALLPLPLVAGALLTMIVYVWRNRLPLARLADAVAPAILVGLSLFGIGNLLAGRAYGLPTDLPWGISLWGVDRHPTQLYELVLILAVLIILWRTRRQTGTMDGVTAAWAALGYGAIRLLVDAVRADSLLILDGFRAAQVVGLLAMLAALAFLWRAHRLPESIGVGEAVPLESAG